MSCFEILPIHGEGDREAVEGGVQHSNIVALDRPPSVTPTARHLPTSGEDFG